MPEDGYGWEKLFSERMCRHFQEDFGLATRVARYHNVYGPFGTYDGGREKAPAAICRKVIQAQLSGSGTIEIWGDGEQTRSFTYIDDCLEGTLRLMTSQVDEPLNVGSDQLVTINQLVDIVERIAGVMLTRRYKLDAPKGVRGRNSDNTLIRERLGWAPSVPLEDGLRRTYVLDSPGDDDGTRVSAAVRVTRRGNEAGALRHRANSSLRDDWRSAPDCALVSAVSQGENFRFDRGRGNAVAQTEACVGRALETRAGVRWCRGPVDRRRCQEIQERVG